MSVNKAESLRDRGARPPCERAISLPLSPSLILSFRGPRGLIRGGDKFPSSVSEGGKPNSILAYYYGGPKKREFNIAAPFLVQRGRLRSAAGESGADETRAQTLARDSTYSRRYYVAASFLVYGTTMAY